MNVEFRGGVREVPPAEWDALVGDGSPFLEWRWLAGLEETGCVGPQTGWIPAPVVIAGERIEAACPAYIKTHSMGEFVFDQGWAGAAERAGIRYYPKLVAAVPFTPVTGDRFLARTDVDRRRLLQALLKTCGDRHLSSLHINFCSGAEAQLLKPMGLLERSGVQYHWQRQGWGDFEGYLASLRSKRRKEVRRERKKVKELGVTIDVLQGANIDSTLMDEMFALYASHVRRFSVWGRQYLNHRFFRYLFDHWRDRLVIVVARQGSSVVAASLLVAKGDALYGRYWGCHEDLPFLHFEVCYYAPIAYCCAHGIDRFEAGAQGNHKRLRGLDAHRTHSLHHVEHPGLRRAVAEFLHHESHTMDEEIQWLQEASAYRRSSE